MASNRKLAKGMILVLAANIFSMAINVLLNFIQPKYLSVETYAAIKTFALYMSCSGLFHLGYEDGMYLKYGGMMQMMARAVICGMSIYILTRRILSLLMVF